MTVKVKVTEIKFDFDLDDEDDILDESEQQEVVDSVLGKVYEIDVDDAEDEDLLTYELLEEVSDQTGWCIENIDYRIVTPA